MWNLIVSIPDPCHLSYLECLMKYLREKRFNSNTCYSEICMRQLGMYRLDIITFYFYDNFFIQNLKFVPKLRHHYFDGHFRYHRLELDEHSYDGYTSN